MGETQLPLDLLSWVLALVPIIVLLLLLVVLRWKGIAGFGAPIAVTAPLLIGVGMRPVYAVVTPLIAHTWAKMFGTLAVGWLAMLNVVEVADPTSTAVQTAILLWLVNLPLINLGTINEIDWLWWLGLALLAVGLMKASRRPAQSIAR